MAYCERCGGTLVPTIGGRPYLRCDRCGTPHTRSDHAPNKFPFTIRLFSGKTGDVIWSRVVTLAEARDFAKVEIPGYAGTEHHPVRVEIAYGDGTTEVGGME